MLGVAYSNHSSYNHKAVDVMTLRKFHSRHYGNDGCSMPHTCELDEPAPKPCNVKSTRVLKVIRAFGLTILICRDVKAVNVDER